jgi:hypothetical protein
MSTPIEFYDPARARMIKFLKRIKRYTTIRNFRIGDRVQDKVTRLELRVVGLYQDGTVYCDFEGNEGGYLEYNYKELEILK